MTTKFAKSLPWLTLTYMYIFLFYDTLTPSRLLLSVAWIGLQCVILKSPAF